MLRRGTKIGKYRLEGRIAGGGFATVYRALDTIEGIRVALKIPHDELVTAEMIDDFRHEARISARLDHPNILPLKNAEFIGSHFVLAHPLGKMTLAERMRARMTVRQALDYGQQILEALAYAHSKGVLHCDVKPENLLVFQTDQVRLTDFGIAKVMTKTLLGASGSGTVGYVAPEQAMGRPSFRSDCFSAGLILYEMLTGSLPSWPYAWPPPGHATITRKVHREMSSFLCKALEVDERRRFRNAQTMLAAFKRVRRTALAAATRRRARRTQPDRWRQLRLQQFRRSFGVALETRYACTRCGGPVSEAMFACPWCRASRLTLRDETRFPHRCRRCRRGMKLDWKFCAWCYGASQGPQTARAYTDTRYVARCPGCSNRLMAFMRYCPWCRRRVQRKWKLGGSRDTCHRCGWGVAAEFWRVCPWCTASLPHAT